MCAMNINQFSSIILFYQIRTFVFSHDVNHDVSHDVSHDVRLFQLSIKVFNLRENLEEFGLDSRTIKGVILY